MNVSRAARAPIGLGIAALLFAALAVHPGCSSSSGGVDGGPDAGSPGDSGSSDSGSSDAGNHDGGSADAGCTLDSQCGTQRWCEKTTGVCRTAKICPNGQGNCDYQGGGADYCAGQSCYCDPTDTSCKPLHLPCTACTASPQCGSDTNAFDQPADCVPASAGFASTPVCIPRRDGFTNNCPQGFTLPTDGGIYCTPAGGKCGAVGGCHSDQDCDPHSATPICDTTRSVCIAACSFDLKTGESICPNGQVCNLTPGLAVLPPSDPNYGKGRCGPPCTSATACGTGLVCRSEGLNMQVMRCGLPPPECLGDVECPNSPSTHSNGYCDLAAHQCHTDCRSSNDCSAGYACTGPAGSMACVAETCLQAGGANLGCDYGQFCCGETNSPSPCPSGVQSGACFDKPPLFCTTCSQDSDCTGSSFPSRAGQSNICFPQSSGSVCAFGCDPATSGECPRGWACEKIRVGCGKDSDCGSQSGAHCTVEDGGSGTCSCTSASACPQGSQATTCQGGTCTITNVCAPNCN